MKHTAVTCGFACLMIISIGCGRYKPPKPPATVAVHGKVFLPDGRPVPGGIIHFAPRTPGKFQHGMAEISPDGSWVATSFEKGDGLQLTDYVIYVEPVSYATGNARKIHGIPRKYQKAETSDLAVSVSRAEADLRLQMR